VLSALGKAGSELRSKLGESIQSVARYDTPVEEATTSSLDALKVYSLAWAERHRGAEVDAVPLLKHAIDLDPNFALAYATLSAVYANLGERQLMRASIQQAFERLGHANEREKLYISSHYYWYTGNPDKALETFQVTTREYPRDVSAHINLGLEYAARGDFGKDIEQQQEAQRLDPDNWFPYNNLANAYLSLNRLDQAKQMVNEEIARKIDGPEAHVCLYNIAFLEHDQAGRDAQLRWANGKAREHEMVFAQAAADASQGRLGSARKLCLRSEQLARDHHFAGYAVTVVAVQALIEAQFGNGSEARRLAYQVATPDPNVLYGHVALALTVIGEPQKTSGLTSELQKYSPQNVPALLPIIQAREQIQQGKTQPAVDLLQATPSFISINNVLVFETTYIRGTMYLELKRPNDAKSDFQSILDHPGISPLMPAHTLAVLGRARSDALEGNSSRARSEYQDFFALWKDADSDIPVLQQAKDEYAKLK